MKKKMITFLIDGKDPITMSYKRWNLGIFLMIAGFAIMGGAIGWLMRVNSEESDKIDQIEEETKKLKERYVQIR